MQYDLFISYSRKDNLTGRVTELKEKIEAEYFEFVKEELKCFFDKKEIKGMEDWKQGLLQGLKDSHLFLIILSPNYLASPHCDWEVVEYLKYEYARATQGDGIAQIYFLAIPGFEESCFEGKSKAWVEKISRRQRFDFLPWYNEGEKSLKSMDVKKRLEELKISLHKRILRMRRISKVPGNLPSPNPRFVGRESEMKLLHESVGLGKFGVLTAVHGMGGLGKTAIAFQYAYAYADFYPGGRWQIGCADETNLPTVLKKLDLDLKVSFTVDEKKDDIRGAKRILNELEKLTIKEAKARAGERNPPKPVVLVILDNVNRAELIKPPNVNLISSKEWLRVLVTTRLGPEGLGSDETRQSLITIDEISFNDAVSLIESYQPDGRFRDEEEKEKAGEIAKMLGCYTLAVEVVALYLYEKKGQISCKRFFEYLKKEGQITTIDNLKTNIAINHNKLISATLAPTLDILSNEESLILNYASLLPPDSIPLPWLRALVIKEYPELEMDAEAGLDDPWLTAINHLLSLRLLQIVNIDGFMPRIMRMHRLVQELVEVRIKERKEGLLNSLKTYVDARVDYFKDGWVNKETRWEINPIKACCLFWMQKKISGIANIVNKIQSPIINLGYFSTGKELLLSAKAMEENISNPSVSFLISYYFNLGTIEYFLGNQNEAKELLKNAIELFRKTFGDHPYIAPYYSNLALVEQAMGKPKEAKELLFIVLELDIKYHGSNDSSIGIDYSNLATVEQDLGNYNEAKDYIKQAISIGELVYPSDHPQLALYYTILALLEQALGNLNEAEPFMRKAAKIRSSAYHPIHPEKANGLVNLGRLLLDMDKQEEAEQLANEAVAIWIKSDNPNDWRLGKAYWILGVIEGRNKDYSVAIEYLKNALTFLHLGRGENHPWISSVKEELEKLRLEEQNNNE